jgi:hypothetical protein
MIVGVVGVVDLVGVVGVVDLVGDVESVLIKKYQINTNAITKIIKTNKYNKVFDFLRYGIAGLP